ncbi:MAG: FecCD family ABC transporter permease [Flavobacteriales bacterium]
MSATLLGVTVSLLILEILLGSVSIATIDVVKSLVGVQSDEKINVIILESRLPRAITALTGGMALALSGWLMQTLFRNPLAGPSILGISSGASLGVALAIMGGAAAGIAGTLSITLAALIGAIAVMLIILPFSYRLKDHVSLLIFGIMLGHFTSAIVSILQFKSSQENLRSFVLWGMGSFSDANFTEILIISIFLCISIIFLSFRLTALNILQLGDEYAKSLGVNVKSLRILLILLSGALAGVVTAFCGPVSFIGLAVPHFARMLFKTSNHQRLFFPLILIGGITGLFSDWSSRMLEIPLNAVTSAIGAPVVIMIIMRYSKSKNYFG